MQDFFHQQYQSTLTDNTLDLKQPKLKVVRMGHELVLYSKGKAIFSNPWKNWTGRLEEFLEAIFLWRYFFAEGTNRISRHDLQKSPSLQWGGIGGHPVTTDYHYRFPDKTKRYSTRVRFLVPDRNLLGVFLGGIFVEVCRNVPIIFSSPTVKS